jgi:predicted DsbA family dithiol-disulfide isomerase
MSKAELLIEVYTDVMCPWCWCGETQLQKTLQSQEFEKEIAPFMNPVVQLKPFILDTRLPATSFEPPLKEYDPIESTDYTKGKPPTKREYYSKK